MMRSKKVPRVHDLSDVMAFWEMKDGILNELYVLLNYRSRLVENETRAFIMTKAETNICKIESLGKKEKE